MKDITVKEKIYQFNELTPDAQDKAIEELADINLMDEYYAEFTLDEAKCLGLAITEYDLYRRTVKGNFTESAEDVANKIVAEHGESCDTYKTAKSYLVELSTLKGIHAVADTEDEDIDTEDIDNEFLHSLLEDYLSMLRKEYEYMGSREAIVETIEANEYGFFEDGKRIHSLVANF
jgi:hypothetical protein